jgi:hypothetical protein
MSAGPQAFGGLTEHGCTPAAVAVDRAGDTPTKGPAATMTSRLSRRAGAAGVLLALALPVATASAQVPAYYPSGPQQNVSLSSVTGAGWRVCHLGNYGQTAALDSVLAGCTGPYLMLMASHAMAGSGPSALLAAGPRDDVLHEAGQASDGSVSSNGTKWYYSDDFSWGFAPAGDAINRNSCDLADGGETSSQLHLCWNTDDGALVPGYRVGDTLINNNLYLRRVLEYVPLSIAGAPASLTFATQAQDTVSTVKTVTWTIKAPPFTSLGKLEVAGTHQDDFFKQEDDCPSVFPDSGATLTCTARVRFIPSAPGARSAQLRFPGDPASSVSLTGTGGALAAGPAGADGVDGVDGTAGAAGAAGAAGINGVDGVDGVAGPAGSPGASGIASAGRPGMTRASCSVQSRARVVCRFDRRMSRGWLVRLHDRRGTLATGRGNGRTVMVFRTSRRPRGALRIVRIQTFRAG